MKPLEKLINHEYGKHHDVIASEIRMIVEELIEKKDYMDLISIIDGYDYEAYERFQSLLKTSLNNDGYLANRTNTLTSIYYDIKHGIDEIINSNSDKKGTEISFHIKNSLLVSEYKIFAYYYVRDIQNSNLYDKTDLSSLFKRVLKLSKTDISLTKSEDLSLIPLIPLIYAPNIKKFKSEKKIVGSMVGLFKNFEEFVTDENELIAAKYSPKYSDKIKSMIDSYIRKDKIQHVLDN